MPVALEPILPHVLPFGLVLARMTGLFLFTPLLSSSAIPRQIKVFLALTMALAVYPTVDHAPLLAFEPSLWTLAPVLASELLIGLAIGILAAIPLMSVQLAGLLMGQQMGLGVASVLNPAADIEGDNIGQILFIYALVLFITFGGVEVVWTALVSTFATLPPGALALDEAPLDLLVGLVAAGFDMAFRIALPVLTIIFIETVAMGLIMKTVPTLNIMSFGFPIRIVLGLGVLMVSLTFIAEAIAFEIRTGLDVVQDWVTSL